MEFRKHADVYDQKGLEALRGGDARKALAYVELASIKRQAADAAEQGREFDWSHYHQVAKGLEGK